MADLGPILSSIMGSQDREFAHQSSMQSASLSAQRSMQSASLANALKIASMNNKTQRYGIDVGAETTRRGQDIGRDVAYRGQDFDLMAKRWTNALNYLSIAAQLRGPSNYFQYANFARGAAGTDFPAFLSSLMTEGGAGGLPDFGAMSGQTMPVSLQQIGNEMSTGNVGQGGGGPSTQGLLAAINQIANNIHQVQPGALESLPQTELGLLQSGAEAAGHDWPTLIARYANAGIGQGSARAA